MRICSFRHYRVILSKISWSYAISNNYIILGWCVHSWERGMKKEMAKGYIVNRECPFHIVVIHSVTNYYASLTLSHGYLTGITKVYVTPFTPNDLFYFSHWFFKIMLCRSVFLCLRVLTHNNYNHFTWWLETFLLKNLIIIIDM